jgi:ABC-type Zn uptake system ZnuABC Zn-binding protein ZnuA
MANRSVRRRSRVASLAVAAIAILGGAACGAPAGASSRSGRPTVDATVAPIVDIVRNVVGRHADVVGLIPEGVDSHSFEPSPATVRHLASADVLFMDGLGLEGSTLAQARANMRHGARIVRLGERTIKRADYAYDFTFPKSKGDPNPHLWMSPPYAKRFAQIVRDTMVVADPTNADAYRENYSHFAVALDGLDRAVAVSIESIPPAHRLLLTYHDSFAYFSRRYGIAVLGAVQPADFSEPSAREVRRLVDQVRAHHVPAIFGSEVFPSTVLAAIARETGVKYVDALRDDELPGAVGAPTHTYVGLIARDVSVMTSALGGDPRPVDALPTTEPVTR